VKALSPMRQKILDFICAFSQEQGYPPSVREICDGVGLKSPSTVHCHLNTLREGGYLEKGDRKTRTLKVVDDARTDDGSRRVPILGRVAAGCPILAQEDAVGFIPFDGAPGGEYFALEVRGDSMIGAGILDGDYIIVRKQETAFHNEIVVALLGEEATVKRYQRRSGHTWLMPENDAYEPIPGDDAVILGRVDGLYRRYR